LQIEFQVAVVMALFRSQWPHFIDIRSSKGGMLYIGDLNVRVT